MRAAIRLTALAGFVGYFGLTPEITYSLSKDPSTQLSNWHPSDEVPCLMWLSTKDLVTGIEGCECITVLERPKFTEASDAR
jgi:hypothetical protein